jgi:hypothetical protein
MLPHERQGNTQQQMANFERAQVEAVLEAEELLEKKGCKVQLSRATAPARQHSLDVSLPNSEHEIDFTLAVLTTSEAASVTWMVDNPPEQEYTDDLITTIHLQPEQTIFLREIQALQERGCSITSSSVFTIEPTDDTLNILFEVKFPNQEVGHSSKPDLLLGVRISPSLGTRKTWKVMPD